MHAEMRHPPRRTARRVSRHARIVAASVRALACALLVAAPVAAWGFDAFTVRDIQVEGVQRTEAGTIFSYLPIKVGERIDDQKVAEAIKALYATGFFRDVRIEAQGDVLVVIVQERPTISSLTFVGNKEFDTDTIKKALKDVGIAEALIFDRSALERAEQELKRQYITRGKYAANVQTTVTPQERNRVAINFTIVEGETASIARINIVGNKAFTEKALRSEILLTTPNWLSWYTKDDQYSKQKLTADLETLRSFYQNRGYLEFNIESTQVSISPDKEEVFITINVVEGPRYTVAGVNVLGDLVVPESEIRRLIQIRPGESFARSKLQASVKDISERMGVDGYAFANVNAVPEIDRAKATVAFTFYVDAGRRAYVRRINISGNSRTRDEVIRRELRQLEDGWYDGVADRTLEGARAPPGLLRGGWRQPRNPARARDARPAGYRPHRRGEEHGQRARRCRLFQFRGRGVQRIDFAAEHLRLGQCAVAGDQHEQDQPDDCGDVRRAVLDGGRCFAHARNLRQVHGPQLAGGFTVFGVDAGRGHQLRDSGVGNRHHQHRLPRSNTRTSRCSSRARRSTTSSSATSDTRPTATSCRAAGRVTRATTSSILRSAACRASWRRSDCPSATSRTTSSTT